ncbi:MAG: ATP-binding cassette domain-containing protein, partial [Sphaerochaetaceae bacterium]|nr:ATP-binding cassette domain-containing protein [Sphaerochaetaceae bacterium]
FDEGSLWLNGKHITIGHPHEALAKGIGYLPEDRLGQGLILDWELYKNVTLPVLDKFSQNGVLDTHSERERTKEIIELLAVKATSVFDKAATLSGGNQQKLIVAKLLTADLKVIILDEPTKGVDVGAKTAIFNIMGDLAQRGYGIIMVSSEMVEVLGVSDRTVVMKEGRIAAIFETAKTTQEQILRAALGTSEEGLDA